MLGRGKLEVVPFENHPSHGRLCCLERWRTFEVLPARMQLNQGNLASTTGA